jgi:pyruvate formate lyase activating enzyme
MKNVLVTNGSVTVETLRTFLPYIDAMNIDLKSFSEAFYRKMGGDLETVKAFIQEAAGACHVEITTLIVTNENDTEEEMEELSAWIASIDPDIPLHVTRFFPRYQMTDRPAADIDNLLRLCETARKHLKYVFPGNI